MIEPVPYEKIEDVFGPPGNPDVLVRRVTPFPLRLSWPPHEAVTVVALHPFIADAFIWALHQIDNYYGFAYLTAADLNEYGGAYADRPSRGSSRKSVHAWGLAVDYLPSMGPYGEPAMTPAPVVDIFRKLGFLWGGDWDSPDGMHFTSIIE